MKSPKQQTASRTDVRLLPAVIGVGAILFGLKAGGMAFSASAAADLPQTKAPPPAQAAVAVTSAPAAKAPADPFAAITANPLTLAIFTLIVGYYVTYCAGVLLRARNPTVT